VARDRCSLAAVDRGESYRLVPVDRYKRLLRREAAATVAVAARREAAVEAARGCFFREAVDRSESRLWLLSIAARWWRRSRRDGDRKKVYK
jgi:hypothetical protein